MLSILSRAVRHYIPLLETTQGNSAAVTQRFQKYASFNLRAIVNESSDEAGTLLHRFSKHIALERVKHAPAVSTTIRYSDYFPVTDTRYFQAELRRTAPEQLSALITFAFTYRSSADPGKFAMVLNDLDAAAMGHLDDMDDATLLNTLYAFLFLIPNWMTRIDFYHAAVRRLVERDLKGDTPSAKEIFIQTCFYLGLAKKQNNQKYSQLLRQLLERNLQTHLPQLTTMDLALVANAAYKTSTVVQNDAYNQKLEQEVLALPLDGSHDALLVTFIKAMRLQRLRSEQVCEHFESICTNEEALRQLQSRGLVHFFAHFAENLWDKSACTEALVTEFVQRLAHINKPQSYEETLRAKDVGTFLWCCSQLNAPLSANVMQRIEAVLMENVRNNQFEYFPDQLVDSCLSLWLLGHRSHKLLQEAVALKSQAPSNNKHPKMDSRLTVLLSAAAIEEPAWKVKQATPFKVNAPAPAYLLKERADLTKYADELAKQDHVSEVKLCCPINGINIPSILVFFDAAPDTPVFVELLTKEQTLHFSSEPVRTLRLKIQLLSALKHKVIVLQQSDIVGNVVNLKDLAADTDANNDEPKEQSVRSI